MSPPATAEKTASLKIALIGNPNTGKSTLFNALAGLQSRVGNYPGVTVEKKIGQVRWPGRHVELIDLPGTYSLAPRSLDEMVAVNVLLGRQADVGHPDAVICIVDASNLERNLYLVSQVLDLGLPTVVVLNMWDVAEARGIKIDPAALSQRLGVPVVKTSAHRKQGVADVRQAVEAALAQGPAARPTLFPREFADECEKLREKLTASGAGETPFYLLERLLLDVGGYLESHLGNGHAAELGAHLKAARERLGNCGCRVPAVEARVRYGWARGILEGVVTKPAVRAVTLSDRIDRWLTHWFSGLLIFAGLMFVVFQAIYTWAGPLMEACEAGQEFVAGLVAGSLPPGPLRSLLADGVVAGVGGVLVFLPQIAFLFFFIALLEDCGYMARAAFLMDKLMTKVGLSGKSFVPLMSSFACAIPGVMATRVIENRRDRMVTILVAPLMSCSARLPVYVLLVTAFIPPLAWLKGWLDLHVLVLLGMISLGALLAIPIAWLLKKTLFKGETPPFVMELPSYKWPSAWIVLSRVYDRSKAFVVRAGTLIFATSIVIWAAGYFPADHTRADQLQVEIEKLEAETAPSEQTAHKLSELLAEQHAESSRLLEQSYLGRIGHFVEPAVRPLGWDWKIGVGAIASFPAREVIISTLGTIYSLGSEVNEENQGLQSALRNSTWPDGRPVYNIPVALSIMVFFALCAQCASTLMVIKRETNSWVWPVFTFVYMTSLAYVAALLTYQVGRLFL
jgi:ferrous iron transport protein B